MNKTYLPFGVLLLLYGFMTGLKVEAQTIREHISFNDNWRFHLGDPKEANAPQLDDRAWRPLDLPHDWSIEGSFNDNNPAGYNGGALPGGIGWYRKSFLIDKKNKEKKIYITFDGVYQQSEVWINGHYLGKRPNGYIGFQYDLSRYLHFGKEPNVIAVKVNNQDQPNSRWYSGSGIYRNVWLTMTEALAVVHHGTYITSPRVEKEVADVEIETSITNHFKKQVSGYVSTAIVDANGKEVATNKQSFHAISPDQNFQLSTKLSVKQPQLWSTKTPRLYKVITKIYHHNKLIDNYETSFGIRSFQFDKEKGFILNGEVTKILGVCNHHDLGALGAAVSKRALERQLELLKAMGCNAIRTSHNPPAPELLNLCDKMGFIVMDETFDVWKKPKTKFGYQESWDAWHQRDLQDHIRRDRNHPSVFIWSIGNEIPEQWEKNGTSIATALAQFVRDLDTSRPITAGLNEPYPRNTIYQSGNLDLVGFNYHHQLFESFQDSFPHQKFIATETTSALQTRGYYQMPSDSIRRWPYKWDEPFLDGNTDHTVSSYDHVSTPWGSTHEETWKLIKKYPYLSGFYIWTGFDYLGEPTPYTWPARSSYFGILDLAGFPKDVYYMYQSEWTQKPVLHLFPHWNWKKGQKVDLWCYYNQADEVELYLNGRSLGKKRKQGDELHVSWSVFFEPGTLQVVSRLQGKDVLNRTIRTATAPAQIQLTADRTTLHADGKDLSFITAKLLDQEGNLIPTDDRQIHFAVEGAATLIATDNGNPTDHTSFQSATRKTMAGLALGVVKSDGDRKGRIQVQVSGEGLKGDVIILESK